MTSQFAHEFAKRTFALVMVVCVCVHMRMKQRGFMYMTTIMLLFSSSKYQLIDGRLVYNLLNIYVYMVYHYHHRKTKKKEINWFIMLLLKLNSQCVYQWPISMMKWHYCLIIVKSMMTIQLMVMKWKREKRDRHRDNYRYRKKLRTYRQKYMQICEISINFHQASPFS